MIMSRALHFADLIYRHHLPDAPKLVHKIAETVPDFVGLFHFHYAAEKAGRDVQRKRDGKVYFMQDSNTGDVKIGFSADNVYGRAKKHANDRQTEIKTILSINGCFQDENDFHHMYVAHNIKAEWYKGTGAVLDSIAAMKRLSESSPNASVEDFMAEARWELLFYRKEIEHYKKLLSP